MIDKEAQGDQIVKRSNGKDAGPFRDSLLESQRSPDFLNRGKDLPTLSPISEVLTYLEAQKLSEKMINFIGFAYVIGQNQETTCQLCFQTFATPYKLRRHYKGLHFLDIEKRKMIVRMLTASRTASRKSVSLDEQAVTQHLEYTNWCHSVDQRIARFNSQRLMVYPEDKKCSEPEAINMVLDHILDKPGGSNADR